MTILMVKPTPSGYKYMPFSNFFHGLTSTIILYYDDFIKSNKFTCVPFYVLKLNIKVRDLLQSNKKNTSRYQSNRWMYLEVPVQSLRATKYNIIRSNNQKQFSNVRYRYLEIFFCWTGVINR